MNGQRHIVEGHANTWCVIDLAQPDKTRSRHTTRHAAQAEADQLNTPGPPRTPQQAQTALFDTQEAHA
jgi:hypothetical protein